MMERILNQNKMECRKKASQQTSVREVSRINSGRLCFLVLAVILILCECSPSGKGGFCEPVELPLLRRLLSLLTDKLDLSFLCILCDTGVDGCFLGCSVVVVPVATDLVPGPDPPVAPVRILAPQEHVRVAPASSMPGWIPLPLLSAGVPALLWRKPFWSLPASPSAASEGTGCESDWGWAGGRHEEKRISILLRVGCGLSTELLKSVFKESFTSKLRLLTQANQI